MLSYMVHPSTHRQRTGTRYGLRIFISSNLISTDLEYLHAHPHHHRPRLGYIHPTQARGEREIHRSSCLDLLLSPPLNHQANPSKLSSRKKKLIRPASRTITPDMNQAQIKTPAASRISDIHHHNSVESTAAGMKDSSKGHHNHHYKHCSHYESCLLHCHLSRPSDSAGSVGRCLVFEFC